MNIDDFIRTLSKRDKKTLTQKALKTVEEVGELAKIILPYESAFATNHRIVNANQILEEVADAMLCLQSIAVDLGFSDDEIAAKLLEKAARWAELQDAELNLTYPLPFEVHITVRNPDVAAFRAACAEIGVKPIVLDLQDAEGTAVLTDVMTSSKVVGTNRDAMDHVETTTKALIERGFDVVRKKIESVPWHPSAPRRYSSNKSMPKDCYFECHFGVLIHPDQMDELGVLAARLDCHRSRNVFKVHSPDCQTVMMTYRRYAGTYEDFKDEVVCIEETLKSKGFTTEKTVIEFSIFDTKVTHDQAWIGGSVIAP